MNLEQAIKNLAGSRALVANEAEAVAAIKAQIQERYGEILENAKGYLDTAKADMADDESRVRELALERYVEEGKKNKKVHPAASIRTTTTLNYNTKEAVTWCIKHRTQALDLNKREFEKVARVMESDCVKIGAEDRVAIATDLSKYL